MGAVYEKIPLKCTEISATKGIEYANKYFKSFKIFFLQFKNFY